MATGPSLTTDAHLKPGEPRGTGGEPLEPQLGSDGRCSRQIHSSPVRGRMGTPLSSACALTTQSGCCLLHREEKRLSPPGHFALGAVKAPAPLLFHSHPLLPGGKTASKTKTCLGNLPSKAPAAWHGVPVLSSAVGEGAEAPL